MLEYISIKGVALISNSGKTRVFFQIFHFFIFPVFIGIIGGFSALLFRFLIHIFSKLFVLHFSPIHYPFLMPVLFLTTSWIAKTLLVSPENVTIDEISRRIALSKGGFNPKKGLLILTLTSFNIGFGVPVGREGPIAKLGGVLSELFFKIFRVDRIHLPIYLTSGISSAIAATFNAPVAGVLFGIEIILGKINTYILIPLIISCGTASIVARHFIGNFTAFVVPHLSWNENYLIWYPAAALVFAIVSLFFTGGIRFLELLRIRLRHSQNYVIFFLGSLVGLLLYLFPAAAGVGYSRITELFQGKYLPSEAFEISLAKLLSSVLSFGAGIFGGYMAPSLFLGSFFGYAFGSLTELDPRVFALVGAVAVLSGVSKAPFRSSLIVVELTHSYQLVVPILLSSALTSYLVSFFKEIHFLKRSLFHKGIDIEHLYLKRKLENFSVSQFIVKIKPVSEKESLKRVRERLLKENVRYLPVVDSLLRQKLVGIVSLRDLRLATLYNKENLKVGELMTPDPFVLYQDSSPEEILKAIALLDANLIPVVEKDGRYIGMFSVDGFLRHITL